MLKSQLIAELQEVPGDPEIFIYADHGQNAEDATAVEYFDENSDFEDIDGPCAVIYGL